MSSIEEVAEIASRIAGRTVGIDERFETIGIDSLMEIELVAEIEDAFGVEISCADRCQAETPRDLANIIDAGHMKIVALAA